MNFYYLKIIVYSLEFIKKTFYTYLKKHYYVDFIEKTYQNLNFLNFPKQYQFHQLIILIFQYFYLTYLNFEEFILLYYYLKLLILHVFFTILLNLTLLT